MANISLLFVTLWDGETRRHLLRGLGSGSGMCAQELADEEPEAETCVLSAVKDSLSILCTRPTKSQLVACIVTSLRITHVQATAGSQKVSIITCDL